MGEKLSKPSKKDIAPAIVVGAVVVTVGYALTKVFEHLKEKADEKKRAELERLQQDIENITDPGAKLVEAGRELVGKRQEIEELVANESVEVNRDAMMALAAMTTPAPKRRGKSR